MAGLVKLALYKSVGGVRLKWSKFEEVLLDVEVALNNCPLAYLEDDAQPPMLTPNAMMFGQPILLPEDDPDSIESKIYFLGNKNNNSNNNNSFFHQSVNSK